MVEQLVTKAKELDVRVRGCDGNFYDYAIYVSFTQNDTQKINLNKLEKSIDLVSDSEKYFSVTVSGRGVDVEGYDDRYTTLYDIRVTKEVYKGVLLYSLQDERNQQNEQIAFLSLKDLKQNIMENLKILLNQSEYAFNYISAPNYE